MGYEIDIKKEIEEAFSFNDLRTIFENYSDLLDSSDIIEVLFSRMHDEVIDQEKFDIWFRLLISYSNEDIKFSLKNCINSIPDLKNNLNKYLSQFKLKGFSCFENLIFSQILYGD